jgi:hypothetical protein
MAVSFRATPFSFPFFLLLFFLLFSFFLFSPLLFSPFWLPFLLSGYYSLVITLVLTLWFLLPGSYSLAPFSFSYSLATPPGFGVGGMAFISGSLFLG